MRTKTFFKLLIVIIIMTSIIVMLSASKSSAALQANQNTQYTKSNTITNWMKAFRQMEAAGGTMGLKETLNSDLTSSSESNNIDVHMMRATEYGAIAILSASGYGNPSNEGAITTTTGNSTGITFNSSNKWEAVAATRNSRHFSGIASIYYDLYTDNKAYVKVGDALGTSTTSNPGCSGWHSSSYSTWMNEYHPYLERGSSGIFSYERMDSTMNRYCRGVVVCGLGL